MQHGIDVESHICCSTTRPCLHLNQSLHWFRAVCERLEQLAPLLHRTTDLNLSKGLRSFLSRPLLQRLRWPMLMDGLPSRPMHVPVWLFFPVVVSACHRNQVKKRRRFLSQSKTSPLRSRAGRSAACSVRSKSNSLTTC